MFSRARRACVLAPRRFGGVENALRRDIEARLVWPFRHMQSKSHCHYTIEHRLLCFWMPLQLQVVHDDCAPLVKQSKSPPLPSAEPPSRLQRPSDHPPSPPARNPQNGETTSLSQARHDLPRLLHHPHPRHLPCVSQKYPPPTCNSVPTSHQYLPSNLPLRRPPQNKNSPRILPQKQRSKNKNKTLTRFLSNQQSST